MTTAGRTAKRLERIMTCDQCNGKGEALNARQCNPSLNPLSASYLGSVYCWFFALLIHVLLRISH